MFSLSPYVSDSFPAFSYLFKCCPKENPLVNTALVFPNTMQRDESLVVSPTTKLGKDRDCVIHNYVCSAGLRAGERGGQ